VAPLHDGEAPAVAGAADRVGRLVGIARHAFPKARMETVDRVCVSVEAGIDGDFRGKVKPGGRGRRQVTLMERDDWDAAMAQLGSDVPWSERRVNLLVDGLDLPQRENTRLRIGLDVILNITCECDPCIRMEAIVPGLKDGLTPDWRGGVCARVLAGGTISVGDEIRIEE
jgi:MOSC domain-containing protein YiiM